MSPAEDGLPAGTPSDIYSFGMCALETAALDFLGSSYSSTQPAATGGSTSAAAAAGAAAPQGTAATNPLTTPSAGGSQSPAVQSGTSSFQSSAAGSVASSQGPNPGTGDSSSSSVASSSVTSAAAAGTSGGLITEEHIQRAIDNLEDEHQKDFIRKCLHSDPAQRPTARECLFHPVLFEVHSLKLAAAHNLVERAEIESSKSMLVVQNCLSELKIISLFRRQYQ